MTVTIKDIRAKYPQYSDLTNQQLADAVHQKFYSGKMEVTDFYSRIGFDPAKEPVAPALPKGENAPSLPVVAVDEAAPKIALDTPPALAAAMAPLTKPVGPETKLPAVDFSTPKAPAPIPAAQDPMPAPGMMGAGSSEQERWARREIARQMEAEGKAVDPLAAAMASAKPVVQAPAQDTAPLSGALAGLSAAMTGPTPGVYGDPAITPRVQKDDVVDPFAGEGFGDLAKRRGQQAARGATEVIASVPEQIAIAGAMADAGKARGAAGLQDQRQQTISDIQARLSDPSLDEITRTFLQDNLASLTEGQGVLNEAATAPIVPAQDRPVFAKGDTIRDASTETFGAPDPRDASFWGKLAEGAGNMTALAGTTLATGLVSGPGGVVVGAGLGSSMNSSQLYKEAVESGATEEDALKAAELGGVVGMTEVIPIGRAFKLLPSGLRAKIGGAFYRKLVDVGANMGEEALQEYSSQVANNLIASGLYDPERGWNEGAGEAAIIGAILGAGTGAVGTFINENEAPARGPRRQKDDDVAIPQMDPIAAAMSGAPQVYTPPAQQPVPPMAAPQAPDAAPAPQAGPVAQADPLAAAMAPAVQTPQAAPPVAPKVDAASDQFEVMDEVETIDGETVPTGRKVRVDLKTGQVSPVDTEETGGVKPDSASNREAVTVEDQPQASSAPALVGAGVPPAAETAQTDPLAAAMAPAAPKASIFSPPKINQPAPAKEAPADLPKAAPALDARPIKKDVAVTPNGMRVPVEYAVVELGNLIPSNSDDGRVNPAYPQERQPRDRTGDGTQMQINDIINKFDPRLMDMSPNAGDGAPIIDPNGIVESGNARTMTLSRIYRDRPDLAQAYMQHLAAQGYPVEGMQRPVLVRVRDGSMSKDDVSAYIRDSNARPQLAMRATELAMSDASALPDSAMSLYRGGDVDAAQNRDFVRGFIQSVVSENERAQMIDAHGNISQDAVRRMQGALLAKAYGDSQIVAALMEVADTEIKAIGGALLDVAPVWAQMTTEAKNGRIAAEMDQTAALLEAVHIVNRARTSKRNVAEFVKQGDLLSGNDGISPMGQRFLALFFRDTRSWTKPAARDRVAQALGFYVDEAMKSAPGADMFGDKADPAAIADKSKDRQYADQPDTQTADLFARPAERDGGGVRPTGAGGNGPGEPVTTGEVSGQRPEGRGEAAVIDPVADYAAKSAAARAVFEQAGDLPPAKTKDVRDTAGGKKLIADLAAAPTMEAKQAVADAFVLDAGKAANVEFFVVLDKEGHLIAAAKGTKTGVSFEMAVVRAMQDGAIGYATHNHPSSRGLSSQDFQSIADGASPAVALGHEYGQHKATLGSDASAITSDQMAKIVAHVERNLVRLFNPKLDRTDGAAVDAANQSFANIVTLALHDMGIISYEGTARADAERLGVDPDDYIADLINASRSGIGRAGYTVPARRGDGGAGGTSGQQSAPGNGTDGAGPDSVSGVDPANDDGRGRNPAGVKRQSPKQIAAARAAALADYFTPGNIVKAYGGKFDRVIAFTPGADGNWSVQVQNVVRDGDGWTPPKGEDIRTHRTTPSEREFKNGPEERAVTDTHDDFDGALDDIFGKPESTPEPAKSGAETYGFKQIPHTNNRFGRTFSKDEGLGLIVNVTEHAKGVTVTATDRRRNAGGAIPSVEVSRSPNWEIAMGELRAFLEARGIKDMADSAKPNPQAKREPRSKAEIAKGLGNLFSEQTGGFSEDAIDPDKYEAAKDLFADALDGIDAVNMPLREVFGAMVRPLAEAGLSREAVAKMRPYFERFIADLKSGKVDLGQEAQSDVSGTSGDLERDSGDANPENRVGATDVPAARRGPGQGAGKRGSAADGTDGKRQDGGGLPDSDAASLGKRGDQGVSGRDGAASKPAADRDSAGGRDRGDSGLWADDGSASDTAKGAANSPGGLNDRAKAQAEADARVKARGVKLADEANVRASLPLLLPEQQDDVIKAEARFAKPDGHGMLLTNGTGTGKTYSGGGVIKRFVQQGKDNILVVAPTQGILDQWIAALADLGIPATKLDGIKDAGKGVVVTTYANMGENTALAGRKWDLVVADESHSLSRNAEGHATESLRTLRSITNRPADLRNKSFMLHATEWTKQKAMKDGEAKTAEAHRLFDLAKIEAEQWAKQPRAKVMFLSATPFAYDKNVDYAEGYLFDYPKDGHVGKSRQSGQNRFMVENFGYRIRYHKLTKPEAAVDSGVFEREFHERLRREGVLSGRSLDVDADYDRKFVQIKSRDGEKIDAVLKAVSEGSRSKDKALADGYSTIQKHLARSFNYLKRMQLLEAIKTRAAIPDIEAHLALGRKVVVFHDFNVGGGVNPFAGLDVSGDANALKAFADLNRIVPDLTSMNFSGYLAPVDAMTKHFGAKARVYNGTVNGKERSKAKNDFNADGSGADIIVVQSAAGEAGISLHDTTGGHQRVLINLGMPTRPTTALQEEGRTRRVGTVSDAPYRYYSTGTAWERQAFAGKIAENSGTVENLALGNEARAIRESFIDAYMEADTHAPGPDDGKGGKERDRSVARTTPYDQAKTHYFGRMKTTGRRDQREGLDFYPTPEPVAFKMVEWAGVRTYERVLEPSAGDGSIARYFPGDADRTIVEPSLDLNSRAQLRSPGARALTETFEEHHIVNKYHAIVMNPPFGSGGKMAFDHVEKAMRHLKDGGRIVALVPRGGMADRRMDGLNLAGFVLSANVEMPAVTFERAGTSVLSRIIVLDKIADPQAAIEAQSRAARINMTGSEKIGDLFERLEGISVPRRPEPTSDPLEDAAAPLETPERAGAPLVPEGAPGFKQAETIHAKTGENLYVATATARVDGDTFKAMAAVAKRHGGWYSSFKGNGAIPGFQFKAEKGRADFIEDMGKPTVGMAEGGDKISAEQRETAMHMAVAAEEITRLMPDLRAALDGMDLKRVRLLQDTGAGWQGRFQVGSDGAMEILIGASLDPKATLHHEAIHALRAMNLFSSEEWGALTEAAPKWVKQFDIEGRYPDLSPDMQIEEAIAEAFGAAVASKRAPTNSLVIRAFNKIGRVMKAIRTVFGKAGFETPEAIFGKVLSGEIARRTSVDGAFSGPRDQRSVRLPSRQARANAATALGGQAVFVPDRRIWEEFSRSGSSIWSRLGAGAAAANDAVDRARIKFQDRFLPVLRAQQAVERASGAALPADQNAYVTETTFSGKVGRHLFEIDEDYTKPIIDMIAETNGDLSAESVGEWLYARHAVERNARIASINPAMPDGGAGMTNADARALLAAAAASPHAATLTNIGALIDALRERTLRLREDAGLITHDEANLWRGQYQAYVPLKGFADTDLSEAMLDVSGVGKRFNTRGGESQRALGRKSEAFNPLQAAITQAQEVAVRAEKNRVGQALYELAKANPSKLLWEVKIPKTKRFYNRTTGLVETRVENPVSMIMEPNELAVKVSGKEHRVIFLDPRLARAAGSVGADQMGVFMRMLSMAGRWFSMTRTMLNPEFMITNAFRDMQTAQINIREFGQDQRGAIGKAMVKSWPKAFVGAWRGQGNKQDTVWTKHFAEFQKAGGQVSFWNLEQPEAGAADLAKRINLASGSIAARTLKHLKPSSVFSMRDNPVISFIDRTNMAVDNAIRLAAFVEARKHGWTEAQAATLSKNLTVNFNRRGEAGATMNALYPFFNAAVQGSTILVQAMRSRRVAKVALALVAAGLVNDLANAYLSEEDEDDVLAYDKIPDYRSQRNFQLMGWKGNDDPLAIPMPYGYNVFPYFGQQIGKVYRGVKTPDEALGDLGAAIFGAFSPVNGGDTFAFLMPTMGDPMLEMARNENWLGAPIRPEYPGEDGPKAYKFYGSASELSKWIAAAANENTGGSVGTSGLIDVSPEYIDHTFAFITGSAGAFWGRNVDLVAKAAQGDFASIEGGDIPVYRTLVSTTGDWLDRDRYFRFKDEVEQARYGVKALTNAGQPVSIEMRNLASLYPTLQSAEKQRKKGQDVWLGFNKQFTRVMGVRGE